VSQLIEATRLDDGQTPVVTSSPAGLRTPPGPGSSGATTTTVSPSHLHGHVQYPNGASSFPGLAPPDAMDAQGSPDTSESRKRCASSNAVDGDRVLKALKLEPQPVKIPSPPPSSHLPDFKPAASSFPYSPPVHADSGPVPSFAPSVPPSSSVSPPSNTNGLNVIDLSHRLGSIQAGIASSDFPPASPAGLAYPSHPPSAWPDRPHVLQHRHTLSGTSLNGGHDHLGLSGPPSAGLPFTSPGAFGHPPVPLSSPLAPLLGEVSRPLINRQTRSMSVTAPAPSPFAFGLPDAGLGGAARAERPRPSTSSGRPGLAARSRHSSAEAEDSDSDSEPSPAMSQDASNSSSRDRSMSRSRAARGSRPSTGHGLQSRASVENVAGGHGNEVPQEYRAEVDRIFFDFLTRICSDRACGLVAAVTLCADLLAQQSMPPTQRENP
jgi:hypothetical protein